MFRAGTKLPRDVPPGFEYDIYVNAHRRRRSSTRRGWALGGAALLVALAPLSSAWLAPSIAGAQPDVRADQTPAPTVLGGALNVRQLHARSIASDGTVVGVMRSEGTQSTVGYARDPETGAMIELDLALAHAINSSGLIVGASTGCSDACSDGAQAQRAAFVPNAKADAIEIPLGSLAGKHSTAVGVNGAGQIIGVSTGQDGMRWGFAYDPSKGIARSLPTWNGLAVVPVAIADSGLIVGYAETTGGRVGVSIDPSFSAATELPKGAAATLQPTDVNAAGAIVGIATSESGGHWPFAVEEGSEEPRNLTAMLGADAVITAINDEGIIAGARGSWASADDSPYPADSPDSPDSADSSAQSSPTQPSEPALDAEAVAEACEIEDSDTSPIGPGLLRGHGFVADLGSSGVADVQMSPVDGLCGRSEISDISPGATAEAAKVVGTFVQPGLDLSEAEYAGFIAEVAVQTRLPAIAPTVTGCVDAVELSWITPELAEPESSEDTGDAADQEALVPQYRVSRAAAGDPVGGVEIAVIASDTYTDAIPHGGQSLAVNAKYWVTLVGENAESVAVPVEADVPPCTSETADTGQITEPDSTVPGLAGNGPAEVTSANDPGLNPTAVTTSPAPPTAPTATPSASTAPPAPTTAVAVPSTSARPVEQASAASPVTLPPTAGDPNARCAGGPQLGINSRTIAQNGTITLSGTCWQPSSAVTLVMYSSPSILGTFAVDSSGRLNANSLVPCAKETGNHRVVATGRDQAGRTVSATVDVKVTTGGCRTQVAGATASPAKASAQPNARTGAQATLVVQLSLALVVCGSAAMALSRRFRVH